MIIDPQRVPPLASYRLLASAIVPRPIAFVSTVSTDGVYNLAPFSFFNAICAEPPVVGFCPTFRVPAKDTLTNIRNTKEFVVNVVSEEIAEPMNVCAGEYAADVDEFRVSGLTPVPSQVVAPPRVLESRVSMECKLMQIVEVSQRARGGSLILGEVLRFHVDDEVMDGPIIDPGKLRAVGRMGGNTYVRTRDRFEMVRPVVA
jgi:flavin reductase (DIM6/NTAB) family NADH-FMN oxidoreductase RutF